MDPLLVTMLAYFSSVMFMMVYFRISGDPPSSYGGVEWVVTTIPVINTVISLTIIMTAFAEHSCKAFGSVAKGISEVLFGKAFRSIANVMTKEIFKRRK